MSFRLPSELHYPCKDLADECGQTLAEWIRRAMLEKLERDREKTAAPAAASEDSRAKIETLSAEVAHMKETIDALKLYIEATRDIEPEKNEQNNTKKRG